MLPLYSRLHLVLCILFFSLLFLNFVNNSLCCMFFSICFRLDGYDPPRARRYFEGEYEDRESAIKSLVQHSVTLYPHDDTLFNFCTPRLVILSCSEYLSIFK